MADKKADKPDKKRNEIVVQARKTFAKKLKKAGVEGDDLRAKVRAFMADQLKPALAAATQEAKAKSLKGEERRKFVGGFINEKLGLNA
jgi:hypothetical protein